MLVVKKVIFQAEFEGRDGSGKIPDDDSSSAVITLYLAAFMQFNVGGCEEGFVKKVP